MILFVENESRCPPGLFGKLLGDWRIHHAVWRPYAGEEPPLLSQISGTIVLGGTMGVHDVDKFPHLLAVKAFLHQTLAAGLPCFGICLGGQLLAEALGGAVHSGRHGEKGCHPLHLTNTGRTDPLLAGMPEQFTVFHWHNDCFDVPTGAAHLACSPRCPGQVIRAGNAWGVQFHPEITESILRNWWQPEEDDPAILTAFQQQQAALQRAGEQLLKNFLRATGQALGI